MIKYDEIIGLNDYFQPAYDLTNETGDYWKQFVPHSRFFEIIRGVLNALDSQQADEKKSFWLQGTYGTGKSHATAVIKHLLFDGSENISDFIQSFQDIQLKSQITHFRSKNRVFPVVIKGLSNVTDGRTFALVIEKSVKASLKKHGFAVGTKSDFEKMVYQLETNPAHIDWDSVILKHPELNMYVKGKDDLIRKLKDENLNILRALEILSSTIGIHFFQDRIDDWLAEVSHELKMQNNADSLMIFWDEFTSVLQMPNSGILLTELQHISELSKNKDVYMFVVSHRSPLASLQIAKDDMEKALGRFHLMDYSMEQITTYHIMGAAIKKRDHNAWTALKEQNINNIDQLIRRIIGTDSPSSHYKLIKDLFPIHPYTAYLSTFIARNIGSTERSIFNFLYDKDNGFKRFISQNPLINENSSNISGTFLTSDYLWDFFMTEFERVDIQRFSTILDKYKLYCQVIQNQNQSYLAVFKGILLLNVLYKMVNVAEAKEDLVIPSLLNIKWLFYGTEYSAAVDAALNFFDERQILAKNPDNIFLISSSSLPFKEIEKEFEGLKRTNSQIDKILNSNQIKEIESSFTANILRKAVLKIFEASLTQHLLKTKLHPPSRLPFSNQYSIHIALLIARNIQEKEEIKKVVQTISKESDFENIIFLIPDTLFDETVLNKFFDYQARANVAAQHNFKDDQASNQEYAKKVLDQWVNSLKNGYTEWYLSEAKGKILISSFNEIVNVDLSSKIFTFGLEKIKEAKKNKNIWQEKIAKTSAEKFLFSDTRSIIEDKTSSGIDKYTREILKNNLGEYIVNEELEFKEDVDLNHPLFKMAKAIETEFENHKSAGMFHLGRALDFLTKPPFGVYDNMIYFSAMGFLMGSYVGKIYESGTGKPIEKEMMRDKIVALFEYWKNRKESNKLEVRLGTREEKKLISLLSDVFGLKNIESLSDARWQIRTWIKDSKYPLWVFKWSESTEEATKTAVNHIIELTESMDREITPKDIKTALSKVDAVKIDLSILLEKSKSHNLFLGWLQGIDNVEIKEENIQSVIEYIRQNMPEEIGVESWKEVSVREKVKDWYNIELKKLIPPPPTTPTVPSPVSPIPPKPTIKLQPETLSEKTPEYKIAEGGNTPILSISEKIEQADGAKLKTILKQVVKEFPNIENFLEKYL